MSPHRRPRGRLRFAAAALFACLSAPLRLAAAGHDCTYGQGPTLSSAILYERLAFDTVVGVVSCRGNVPAPGGTVGGGQGVADFYPLQGSVPARDALYPGDSIAVDGLLNGIGTKDFAVMAWIWPHVGDQERGVLIDAIGPGFRDARLYLGVGFGRFEADIWTGTDLQSLQAGAPDIYGSPSVPKWIHVGVTRVGKEARMYINGLNVGGATVMSGVGDMSDITQTLIGTTANTAWPGWADDFRVYVGTVSPEEMYAIFRVSHSAYNAVQQVGFSAFNVTFPAQPGGDTKMFLGFNATYNNTIYKLTPSSGTSSGSPAVLGEDVAVRGPLRGFGINMLGPPFSWPYGGYIAQNHAWVFTTGDLPSRIRVFRPDYTYDGNVNGQQFVCDFVLVLAPNGMIQGEATETFLARDQGVTVPQFERPDQPVHPVRPELGRSLLPQITSYVMAPRTTYAVATTNCNIAAFASYILPGDVGPILVTDRGFSAGFALMRNNYGEAWSNYGGLYLYFDLEVENPGFQGVDNAVDGSGLVPTGAYPTGWGVNDIAASFTVGPADIRLDRFTIRVQNLTLDWFSCTVELYSVSSGQPALPTGPPLAAGQLMASGHSATATSLSFMFPETVAEVLLRRGQRYSFKIGPCDHDGLSWAYVTTPGRRIRRGPVTSGDVSVDTGLSYDSSTGQWSTIPAGNELIWSMDISKEPVPPYDYATGSVVVAFPAGQCGATGTYGVKFTPSCDLPCPELPPFQVNAAIAEPDEWCRDNRTAAPFTVGPHTITVTEVPGPTIRYPGDWALWYLRIRTDGTQMKSVVLRNATLELPDRAVGSQWRSRVLWYPGAAMPLGNALKFPPGGSEILYQVPSTCAAGTANDTGADCVRVGVRLNMGNSPNSHALQEGVDSGLTRVRLVLSVDVKYWDETQPARKRDLGGGGTEALVVRAEMTVRMGTPVAGRRLKVHGE